VKGGSVKIEGQNGGGGTAAVHNRETREGRQKKSGTDRTRGGGKSGGDKFEKNENRKRHRHENSKTPHGRKSLFQPSNENKTT